MCFVIVLAKCAVNMLLFSQEAKLEHFGGVFLKSPLFLKEVKSQMKWCAPAILMVRLPI